MDIQTQIFLGYLDFLEETETDEEVRDEKATKAVLDFMLGKRLKGKTP